MSSELRHLVSLGVVLWMSSPAMARADESLAPMMMTLHELPASTTLNTGTVAIGLGTGALFASTSSGATVSMVAGKPKVTEVSGHPQQAHHKSSESISLGAAGALVLLTDDRNKLAITRYDASARTWTSVERPIGFVPRGAVVIGDTVVFPQNTTSPAWFVYEVGANTFRRVERAGELAACSGVAFSTGSSAAVAGRSVDKRPCTLALDPATGVWSALPPPPVGICEASVAASDELAYFISPRCPKGKGGETLLFDANKGAWSALPSPPTALSEADHAFVTRAGVAVWRLARGGLHVSTFDGGQWSSTEESTPVELRKVAKVSNDTWWASGVLAGAPVLIELSYAPRSTPDQRAANRALLHPAAQTKPAVDWKSASEEERRAAVTKGLGAVERYVPPEVDPTTKKLVTKGAWVFALGEELVVWPVTPKKCAAFIDRLIAKWPTESVGTQWKVRRGAGFAMAGRQLLYGPAPACRQASHCATDYFSERHQPLSQVGPIFSYSTHRSEARDCGDPVATEKWTAIDLRSGSPAKVTAVIEEASLLAALQKHKTTSKWTATAGSLEEALAALRAVDPAGVDGYAFGAWRSMTRRVELRLEFHPDSVDLVEPIRLWVDPLPEFIETFEAASRIPGLLMSASE